MTTERGPGRSCRRVPDVDCARVLLRPKFRQWLSIISLATRCYHGIAVIDARLRQFGDYYGFIVLKYAMGFLSIVGAINAQEHSCSTNEVARPLEKLVEGIGAAGHIGI